jgi:hypothetical protein
VPPSDSHGSVIEPASDGLIEPCPADLCGIILGVLGITTLRRLVRRRGARSKGEIRNPLVGLVLSLAGDDPDYPRIGFGIGCFHFGAHPETFDGSAAGHIEQIRSWLASESAISNIEIRDAGEGWFESGLDYGLANGGQPFPAIRGLRVDFDLRVLPQVQQEFRRWDLPDDPLDLRISIRQGAAVPVAFVVPSVSLPVPSIAVTLAWHTLRRLVPDDGPLVFDMRGPSPIHVQCFLVPAPEPDFSAPARLTFELQQIQAGPGYPLAAFAYDPRAFAHINEASEGLFHELEIPVGAYYEIEGAAERSSNQSDELEAIRNRLVELERRTGLRGYARRRISGSGVMRELAIAITEFEADAEIAQAESAASRRSLEEMPGTRFLLNEMDDLVRTGFKADTDRFERLLDLFERRRLSGSQNLIALVSALLAAVIGATSALWVSGQSGSTPHVTVVQTTAPARQFSPPPQPLRSTLKRRTTTAP